MVSEGNDIMYHYNQYMLETRQPPPTGIPRPGPQRQTKPKELVLFDTTYEDRIMHSLLDNVQLAPFLTQLFFHYHHMQTPISYFVYTIIMMTLINKTAEGKLPGQGRLGKVLVALSTLSLATYNGIVSFSNSQTLSTCLAMTAYSSGHRTASVRSSAILLMIAMLMHDQLWLFAIFVIGMTVARESLFF